MYPVKYVTFYFVIAASFLILGCSTKIDKTTSSLPSQKISIEKKESVKNLDLKDIF